MLAVEFINLTEIQAAEKIGLICQKDYIKSGILASVSSAQMILESGYVTTELAQNANNCFGMKCSLSGNTWSGSSWDGVTKYNKRTPENDENGNLYYIYADFRKYPCIEDSVADHSAYLLGAMNGSSLRYEGLKGEKYYKKAIQIIKDGGYATDVSYVSKICSIIERFNLTRFDNVEVKEEEKMNINIVDKIAYNNPCYKNAGNITPKGGMLHSVGCSQPDPLVFVNNWQSSSAEVCVHAVVGKDEVYYQLLPWNHKAWHCGSGPNGSGNSKLISIEMTEPASIHYTGGGNWYETGDGSNTKSHVLQTYKNAVKFFAYICQKYGFNPLDSNVLMSHSEGHSKGIASNHGDVEHIWNKFGLSMNQFRKDVRTMMDGGTISVTGTVSNSSGNTSSQAINKLDGKVTVIYKGSDGLNIRKAPSITSEVDQVVTGGVFTVVGISKDEKWYKLKSGLYITTITDYVSFKATEAQKQETAGTGYFRVRKSWGDASSQIGAFKDENNAIEMCKQNSGYIVFNNDGKQIYPTASVTDKAFQFRVNISDLRIRKGPGTGYDYWKDNGLARYTGKGTFTIVETKDGPGAELWGLLKSYAGDKNGWIALDASYGQRV